MELLYQIPCLSRYCTNGVEEFRIEKQNGNISRWYFCLRCIKKRDGVPLEYFCKKENCNNILCFDGRPPAAFCSAICKSRHHYNTRNNEMRQCKVCEKLFESNLGNFQIYCDIQCRKKASKSNFVSSQTLIVQLLQKGNCDLDKISRYVKKDYTQVRNLITILRKKGHHISLTSYGGQYKYEGFLK